VAVVAGGSVTETGRGARWAISFRFSAIAVIGGLVLLFRGGSGTVVGLIWIVVGPLVARVYCEILIVIFRINETLTDIRDNTRPTQAAAPPSAPPAPEPAS
jgi:hypothetical protein